MEPHARSLESFYSLWVRPGSSRPQKSIERLSIPAPPVRRVSGATPGGGHSQHFQALPSTSSYIKIAAPR
jgi:hypothetical protein